ncbi:glycosyltransferase family 4 protein [Guptibacillus hwajinpoensis]|uniref:glycosyltransferase family 4 protein n=1 Tax=Guptibacillus hwajinpoensis TaxID=208199 RepID=UPI003D06FEB9
MKLLIINYLVLPLPPVKGGAVENLIDMFIQDNEETHTHDITVYSIYDEKAKIASNKYKHCTFNYIKMDSFKDKINTGIRHLINRIPNVYTGNNYIMKVKKELLSEGDLSEYDAIIIENAPEFGLILRKLYKGKLILHLHNDSLNKSTKLAGEILNSYDSVFALSDFVGNRVKSIRNSEKIHTLYNGIDLKRFNRKIYNTKEIRQELGVEDKDTVILFSGRLVPEKGVKELLNAYTCIPNRKNIKLLIMGSSKYGDTIVDEYYRELWNIAKPLCDEIKFLGYVPYEDVPKIYSIADVGIVPSLCNDGFNLTVVELMANEVPVIISDQGAMKEIINNDCGIVVNYSNKFVENLSTSIEIILNNKKTRVEMGSASLRQAQKFDKSIYCNRFNFLLNNVNEGNI